MTFSSDNFCINSFYHSLILISSALIFFIFNKKFKNLIISYENYSNFINLLIISDNPIISKGNKKKQYFWSMKLKQRFCDCWKVRYKKRSIFNDWWKKVIANKRRSDKWRCLWRDYLWCFGALTPWIQRDFWWTWEKVEQNQTQRRKCFDSSQNFSSIHQCLYFQCLIFRRKKINQKLRKKSSITTSRYFTQKPKSIENPLRNVQSRQKTRNQRKDSQNFRNVRNFSKGFGQFHD